MTLITGANGHLGTAVIDFLLKKNPSLKIAGLVRSEEKGQALKEKGVELRMGDYTDASSLKNAVKNIDTLLLISSGTLKDRIKQHVNVINAAKEAGVKHILYTSIVQAEKKLSAIAVDHFETEEAIKASGINYTILRNTYYSEFFQPIFLGNAVETGEWYYPANGSKINMALRTEMAEAAANILLDVNNHVNKTYEITSGQSYSFSQLAGIVSVASEKQVRYADLSLDSWQEGLSKAPIPNDVKDFLVDNARSITKGSLDYTDVALENLLGRKPQDLAGYIYQTVNNSNK